jgi:hypothetical protein
MAQLRYVHEAGTAKQPQFCRRCGDELKYDTAFPHDAGTLVLDTWEVTGDTANLASRESIESRPEDVAWCNEVDRPTTA